MPTFLRTPPTSPVIPHTSLRSVRHFVASTSPSPRTSRSSLPVRQPPRHPRCDDEQRHTSTTTKNRQSDEDDDEDDEDEEDEEECKQNLADDEAASSSDRSRRSSSRCSGDRLPRRSSGRLVTQDRGSPCLDSPSCPHPRCSPLLNSLLESRFSTRLSTPPDARRFSTPPRRPPRAPRASDLSPHHHHHQQQQQQQQQYCHDTTSGSGSRRQQQQQQLCTVDCGVKCEEDSCGNCRDCCGGNHRLDYHCHSHHHSSPEHRHHYHVDHRHHHGVRSSRSPDRRGTASSAAARRSTSVSACHCSGSCPQQRDYASCGGCGGGGCPHGAQRHSYHEGGAFTPTAHRRGCLGTPYCCVGRGDPDGRRGDADQADGGRWEADGTRRLAKCGGKMRGVLAGGSDDAEGPRCDGAALTDELPDYIALWSCHNSACEAEQQQEGASSQASLELQVSVLTEQVAAQAEKIQDMEAALHSKTRLLLESEEKLHKEIMAVSALETQRLQLLSQLSTLQLQQASSQHAARLPHLQGETGALRDSSTPVRCNTAPASQLSPLLAGFTSPSPSTVSGLSCIPSTAMLPYAANNNGAGDNYFSRTPRTPPPSHGRQLEPHLRSARSNSTSASTRYSGNNNNNSNSINGTANTLPACGKAETETIGDLASSVTPIRDDRYRPSASDDRQNYGPADGDAGGTPGLPTQQQQLVSSSSSTPSSGAGLKTLSSGNLHNIHSLQQYSDTQHTAALAAHKPNTIRKIFTRLRRSSSGHVRGGPGTEDSVGRAEELRRGGLRATATARLGWSPVGAAWREPPSPFLSWACPECERWLEHLGLGQYCTALRCWMAAAPSNHLSRATPHQLDKQLGVRHPLHRKKLQLAINARMGVEGTLHTNSPAHQLEGAGPAALWTCQWLDDVGLPQYKDAFQEARLDPRVLDVLTWDDLAFLRVTSLLHATSLKRGVQVLREHNYDSSALIRRSTSDPEDSDNARAVTSNGNNNNNNNNTSSSGGQDVSLWTNHRVMEWLRTVDLSEYAPNLRGSGVHGALMVYEVRFTAEVLAALLSIPSSKTLLRRHLYTHFKELVGREVVQEKRQVEDSPGYSPLTTATKIKPHKRSQFSLKRRSGGSKGRGTGLTLEFDDLLCPLEERPPRAAVQRALENSQETRLC